MDGVSLKPSDFRESTFLDDVDVIIKECRFTLFDFNGAIEEAVPCLKVEFETEDGTIVSQHYGAGFSSEEWQPSEDGHRLVPCSTHTQMSAGNNCSLFIQSLVNSGFDEDKIENDVTIFEGLNVHVAQMAAPRRKKKADDDDKVRTILLVTGINEDATKAKSKAGSAKKSSKKGKAPKSDDSSDVEFVTDWLIGKLGDGAINKSDLPALAFKDSGIPANKKSMTVKLVFSDDFLNSGPWTFDGKEVKLG